MWLACVRHIVPPSRLLRNAQLHETRLNELAKSELLYRSGVDVAGRPAVVVVGARLHARCATAAMREQVSHARPLAAHARTIRSRSHTPHARHIAKPVLVLAGNDSRVFALTPHMAHQYAIRALHSYALSPALSPHARTQKLTQNHMPAMKGFSSAARLERLSHGEGF